MEMYKNIRIKDAIGGTRKRERAGGEGKGEKKTMILMELIRTKWRQLPDGGNDIRYLTRQG